MISNVLKSLLTVYKDFDVNLLVIYYIIDWK